MVRLLLIALVLAAVCRWVLGRWPWDYLAGSTVRGRSLARARSVLGVAAGASRDEVIAAHRSKVASLHPDRGGSTAAMQEVNAARDLLLGAIADERHGDGMP